MFAEAGHVVGVSSNGQKVSGSGRKKIVLRST